MNEMAVTGRPLSDYERYVELLSEVMANGLALATDREFLATLDPTQRLGEAMREHARSAIQWRFAHHIDEIESATAPDPAIERVRALHTETACEEDCCGSSPCCADCGPGAGWPCPTIQALGPLPVGGES